MRRNNIYTINPIIARAQSNRSSGIPVSTPVSNMSISEKSVLSSTQASIEPNQFAFSYIDANGAVLAADTPKDTIQITTELPLSATVTASAVVLKIVEDPNHLFVTQAKITEWDNKSSKTHVHRGEDITSGLIAPEVIAVLPIDKIDEMIYYNINHLVLFELSYHYF